MRAHTNSERRCLHSGIHSDCHRVACIFSSWCCTSRGTRYIRAKNTAEWKRVPLFPRKKLEKKSAAKRAKIKHLKQGGGARVWGRTIRVMAIMVPAVPEMKEASPATCITSMALTWAATLRVGWLDLQNHDFSLVSTSMCCQRCQRHCHRCTLLSIML